jgi:hypothetical protein
VRIGRGSLELQSADLLGLAGARTRRMERGSAKLVSAGTIVELQGRVSAVGVEWPVLGRA